MEVIKFNSKQVVDRRTEMKDGVLLSRGRIIDGMNFIETADLDTLNLDNLNIKTRIPVIDRFSPLAYSLAQHFHWTIAKHRGMETCLRMSLEHVHILQGMSLFKELSEECIRCKMKRGKFIRASMGPLSAKQFIVAPPFYACQVDLFGPCRVFVPGHEKETRATKVKESKVWVFVAVCVVTSTVNMQVCEMKDTAAMMEAFIRLSCEVGYPKYVMCDKDSSLLAAAQEIKVNLRNLSHQLYSEHGIMFETCAVGGHDQHGKVERTIRTIQDSLEDFGWKKMRIHAMGVQTLCKQVENAYNNLPLGYRYERGQDNTKTLKMLVPNMLRLGRINSRALDGPVRLSNENRKMLGEVQDRYEAWYKIWCEVYVPKLMSQKKEFKNDRDLEVDNMVYYQKKESELGSPWVIGKIDQIVRGRDGVIRKIIVKYTNPKENFARLTERSARKVIRIWSADDPDLQADMLKVQARIDQLQGHLDEEAAGGANAVLVLQDGGTLLPCCPDANPVKGCQCCCLAHCKVTFHNIYGSKPFHQTLSTTAGFELAAKVDNDVEEQEHTKEEDTEGEVDNITALIMSVGVDFS